jgi:hypothetical protein
MDDISTQSRYPARRFARTSRTTHQDVRQPTSSLPSLSAWILNTFPDYYSFEITVYHTLLLALYSTELAHSIRKYGLVSHIMTEPAAPRKASDKCYILLLPKELRLMIYAYLAYPYRKDTILVPASRCSCERCVSNGAQDTEYYCMCVYCMQERDGHEIKRPPRPFPLTLITPCQYPQAILACRSFYTEITWYMDTTERAEDRAYTTPRAIVDVTGVVNDDDVEELFMDLLRTLQCARDFTWGMDGADYASESQNWGWDSVDALSMQFVHRFLKASGRHLFENPGAWFARHEYDYVREARGEWVDTFKEREQLEQQVLETSRGPHDGLNLLFRGENWEPVGCMDEMLSLWKLSTYKSKDCIDMPVYLYRETDEPIQEIEGPRGCSEWYDGAEEYHDTKIQLQDMGRIGWADWLEYWA